MMVMIQVGRSVCGPRHLILTLKTLTWQEEECRCSVYSSLSFSLNVSIWMRKGTPFSPPCFRMVNSVLMQCTWAAKDKVVKEWGIEFSRERKMSNCCLFDTWINTEVLFDGSQRNSTVLSWVGFALGSIMPTDIGISATKHKENRLWHANYGRDEQSKEV